MSEKYNTAKSQYSASLSSFSSCLSWLNSVASMYSNGISINKDQIDNEIKVKLTEQTNLMQINKKIIDQYEGECRYYTLCLINYPSKDYYMYYQVAGGSLELYESFVDCVKREVFEETKLDLKDFHFIAYNEGFRIFPDCPDCEIMFKTAIYLTITDEIPQLTEPDRNSAWEAYTINEFKNLKVTDSLRLKESAIIEAINSKFRNHRKRKIEINHESQKQVKIDPEELNEPEYTTSSPSLLQYLITTENFGLLAFDVKVNRGDHSIDIIITYKQKLIFIQCKNTETPIPVQIVRVFESAISRFASDSLGIIMYNSEKLKEKGKFATLKAKQWAHISKRNIKFCNKDQFVEIIKEFYKSDNDDYIKLVDYKADRFNIVSLLGENVSIGRIIFLFITFKTIDLHTMSKLFDEQTQELAKLNGLLSTFHSYVNAINGNNNHCTSYMKIALKIQLKELEEFDFKHYKNEFKTSKEKIMRIINRKLDPELVKMKEEYQFYSASNKIYQEDHRYEDVKIFNKFLVDKYEKDYIDRKVNEIESLTPYKVIFVNPSLETTIDHKKRQNRKSKKCLIQYLRDLYDFYQTGIDVIYNEYIMFKNENVLCKDCLKFSQCKKNCDFSSYESLFEQLL
ncbi:10779_t:CDS:2 [Cetraspora pellucida]|uniref:10779_t:CDS:1 n=1 Tax=Cetraspora pellucida TaxID=1433469 RepID=A0A9N9CPL3_9GLOM|nr:10779_t:CDS:2 [Cetraspora pellucida]